VNIQVHIQVTEYTRCSQQTSNIAQSELVTHRVDRAV